MSEGGRGAKEEEEERRGSYNKSTETIHQHPPELPSLEARPSLWAWHNIVYMSAIITSVSSAWKKKSEEET